MLYKDNDWAAEVKKLSGGVDVVLDMVAGDYLPKNLQLLKQDGRCVVIALLGGATAKINAGFMMVNRLTLTGSTLRYAHFTKTEFPNFSQALSWLGCDLMIQGLERAGHSPSRASVVKALRGIKAYNANGLLPVTINYSTIFGHDLPQCAWVVQAQKSGFVPVSAKPFCGTDYAGTSTLKGS